MTLASKEPKPPFPKQHLEKPGSDADSSSITGAVLTLLGGETAAG